MARYIRALIVDDRLRSRNGLQALLATIPEIQIVGEATNGEQAVRQTEKYQPDAVLMDVHMPVLDGLEATRLIKSRWPEVKVIILTIDSTCRVDALAAGADAFLVKGGPPETLLETILSVSNP
jgi:DNA-binding NarL/FixJ family response regulator